MSPDHAPTREAPVAPPQLVELGARIERLLREHQRLGNERDTLATRVREQSAEIEELKRQLDELVRSRDAARVRLDGVIGHLDKLESRM